MKYDYWVKTKEISPSLGENKYAAVAEIHEIGKGAVQHNLGETWGKTKGEAEEKMNKKIKIWLEQNI